MMQNTKNNSENTAIVTVQSVVVTATKWQPFSIACWVLCCILMRWMTFRNVCGRLRTSYFAVRYAVVNWTSRRRRRRRRFVQRQWGPSRGSSTGSSNKRCSNIVSYDFL